MGIGKITEARETTEGTLSSPQGGAGAAAEKLASVGDRAGREAHQTISRGLGDAAKNIGDALKVAGDFAVKTLWEKPIAEAEEKIRELDVKCRKEGWRDLHGVERPGFELYRGVEAMDVGERWDAYMARESKKISEKLSDGQREELSRRTRKLRVETKARLVEFGLNEAMTSNLRDIDRRATRGAERSILDAVDRANADRDTLAKDAAYHSGNAEDGAAVLSRKDDAAAVGLFDALAEKRAGLIRDKVIGGLGRKSEAQATAEADALVRAEALETVEALAAAGHYDRARKLVEQGRRAVDDDGARLFDDAALAKGRELVDGMEMNATTANGLKAYGTVWDSEGNPIPERDKILDAQIATLKRVAENAPKGSHTAIAALQQAGRFEEAADSIAFGYLVDRMANGDGELFDTDKNGKAVLKKQNPFSKGTRAARLWPKAVEAWERKRTAAFNAAHKVNIAQSRENALRTIADPNGNPQAYVDWLLKNMESGSLDANDVVSETNRFRKMWISGTGDGQTSRLQRIARQMLDDVNRVLGVDFAASVNVDSSGNPTFDSDGALSFRKDAVKPGVPYSRWKDGGEMSRSPQGFESPIAYESFTADEWLEVMNMALKLSMANGAMINEIPIDNPTWNLYGEAMKELIPNDAKTIRRVDAVRDFRTYLERLKKGKDVSGAAEELAQRKADFNLVNETAIRRTDPFVMRQRNVERANRRPGPWKE